MRIGPGQRLGPYELISPLGRGAMGEVYRARDTRLGREVAIKVLPEPLAGDSSRKARMEREAKTVARLSHSNICALHDVGCHDGVDYLVMECLEGETLASRLERGPLAREDALGIARQMASALAAAHGRGVIHRDLKPGNVMLTPSGVKLLDFGLAKSIPTAGSGAPTAAKPLTQEGSVLGTLAYMAPEQLEGKEADERADIYALGAVLYEMLTGRRVYDEEIRATLEPPLVEGLVSKALARSSDERWQSARDFEMLLGFPEPPPAASPRGPFRLHLAWLSLLVLAGAAAWYSRPDARAEVTRLSVNLPEGQLLYEDEGQSFDISRDGRRLVFASRDASRGLSQLYVRELESFQERLIPGSDYARQPVLSPDGETLAFVDGPRNVIRSIPLRGGSAVDVCVTEFGPAGLAWSESGRIYFGTEGSGVWRVSETGGAPERVTALSPGESDHIAPSLLPDGRGLLFTANMGGDFRIGLLPEGAKEHRVLFDGYGGSYVSSGHIVFGRFDAALFAVPFDLASLEVTGAPVPLADVPATTATGWRAQFRTGAGQTLVYVPTGASGSDVVWVDRNGESEVVFHSERRYHTVHLSPEGTHFVADEAGGGSNRIWVHDLDRGTRLLAASGYNLQTPRFDPGGGRITYSEEALMTTSADGAGQPQELVTERLLPSDASWSSDGRFLAFEGDDDIWIQPRGGEPRRFLVASSSERAPAISPDGRWIAYQSDASGRAEIYVEPFPDGGTRHLISTRGGKAPVWSRDGRELFYREEAAVMAVAIDAGGSFRADAPERVLDGPYVYDFAGHPSYDVAPDGERFLMIRNEAGGRSELRVVLNLARELEERVRRR